MRDDYVSLQSSHNTLAASATSTEVLCAQLKEQLQTERANAEASLNRAMSNHRAREHELEQKIDLFVHQT